MRAILTFTCEHTDYLPKWKKYYSKFFNHLEIIKLAPELLNNDTYVNKRRNEIHRELLKKYEVVAMLDVDEFLIPTISKNLALYMNDNPHPAVRAVGYNVLETGGEAPLDLTKRILRQRKYWSRDVMYNKVVIVRKPITFKNQHETHEDIPVDKNLVLAHLRDADIRLTQKRFKARGVKYNMQHYIKRLETKEEIPDNLKKI